MESEAQNELCRSCEARAYPVEAPRKQVPNTESATEFRASERIKRRNKILVFNPRRSAQIRANPERNGLVSKQMRLGQPPSRIVRGFLLLPCHRLATK
jgi:hypothetical protein